MPTALVNLCGEQRRQTFLDRHSVEAVVAVDNISGPKRDGSDVMDARNEPVRRQAGVIGVIACERDALRVRDILRSIDAKRSVVQSVLDVFLGDCNLGRRYVLGIVRVTHRFSRQTHPAG